MDLLSILEQHLELLQQKGYEEIGLGTLEEPGIYLQQLEKTFSFHLQKAQFNKKPREFDVRGVGFFNDEKNLIDFIFHYELDPKQQTIELKSFSAEMDGVAKGFVLENTMYNLPNVEIVLSILQASLKEKQEKQVTGEMKQAIPEGTIPYKEILAEHHSLLVSKGYTNKEIFPYTENFLFKKLEHKLSSKYSSEEAAPDFLIRLQGLFNDRNDEVKYNFFYSLDRDNNILQLNSMVAELKDKRICYPIKEATDLSPAMNVFKHLTNALKAEKAQIIYPKEKIKILLKEQERILGTMGYYKTVFDNNTNFIERELQGILNRSLNEHEQQIFPINRQIHLNVHDTMHCRFEYSFDPVQIQLSLESITAQVGIVERKYSIAENEHLKLQEIHAELKEQNRLLNAHKISQGSDSTGMKAMIKHLQNRPS